jgi:hypothetical protein
MNSWDDTGENVSPAIGAGGSPAGQPDGLCGGGRPSADPAGGDAGPLGAGKVSPLAEKLRGAFVPRSIKSPCSTLSPANSKSLTMPDDLLPVTNVGEPQKYWNDRSPAEQHSKPVLTSPVIDLQSHGASSGERIEAGNHPAQGSVRSWGWRRARCRSIGVPRIGGDIHEDLDFFRAKGHAFQSATGDFGGIGIGGEPHFRRL